MVLCISIVFLPKGGPVFAGCVSVGDLERLTIEKDEFALGIALNSIAHGRYHDVPISQAMSGMWSRALTV